MSDNLEIRRKHSGSHIMTAAVEMLRKNVGLGVGPWTDEGFYQDFDLGEENFSEKELKDIEKKMRWIVNKDFPIKKEVVGAEKALEIAKGDPYKTELVQEIIDRGEEISFYYIGEELDKALSVNLCAGPHLESTGQLGAFKLTKLAGAYWRGDENKPQLQRIYGVAFETKEEIDEYLHMIEEAKKRDHRKLGKELGLFIFSELIGPGMPIFTPKGAILRKNVIDFSRELNDSLGFGEVHTPNMNKAELFKVSGHYDKYKDDMLQVHSHYTDEEYYLKPMNCPQHTQLFASEIRSYKDLPIRFSDFANLYRDEKPGELSGLTRLRCFCQDDGHSFCREDQIESEFENILGAIKKALNTYGLDYKIRLSLWDEDEKEKYLGDDSVWEKSQKIMKELLDKNEIPYFIGKGEAAFYGPKMDIVAVDSLKREWQISTIQLDFNMPKRFELSFVDEKGENQTPIMIHRALVGSPERFLGILIEHYAGAFPVWMSPEQVHFIPVSNENHLEGALKLSEDFKAKGIRVSVDKADETVGKKIRKASKMKVPYVLVVGEKELSGEDLMVRVRGQEEQISLSKEAFIERILDEIKTRK